MTAMRCVKCYKQIQTPRCHHCGFSHREGVLLLGQPPASELALPVDLRLSENPTATELWELVQYGEEGNKEACQLLADYYFSRVPEKLLKVRRDISEYRIAKQVSPEISRAIHWVRKLYSMKGTLSSGQRYLLSLELMLEPATGTKGFNHLEKAAREGYRPAVWFLAVCLQSGYYCKKDLEAARWWECQLYR